MWWVAVIWGRLPRLRLAASRPAFVSRPETWPRRRRDFTGGSARGVGAILPPLSAACAGRSASGSVRFLELNLGGIGPSDAPRRCCGVAATVPRVVWGLRLANAALFKQRSSTADERFSMVTTASQMIQRVAAAAPRPVLVLLSSIRRLFGGAGQRTPRRGGAPRLHKTHVASSLSDTGRGQVADKVL